MGDSGILRTATASISLPSAPHTRPTARPQARSCPGSTALPLVLPEHVFRVLRGHTGDAHRARSPAERSRPGPACLMQQHGLFKLSPGLSALGKTRCLTASSLCQGHPTGARCYSDYKGEQRLSKNSRTGWTCNYRPRACSSPGLAPYQGAEFCLRMHPLEPCLREPQREDRPLPSPSQEPLQPPCMGSTYNPEPQM